MRRKKDDETTIRGLRAQLASALSMDRSRMQRALSQAEARAASATATAEEAMVWLEALAIAEEAHVQLGQEASTTASFRSWKRGDCDSADESTSEAGSALV